MVPLLQRLGRGYSHVGVVRLLFYHVISHIISGGAILGRRKWWIHTRNVPFCCLCVWEKVPAVLTLWVHRTSSGDFCLSTASSHPFLFFWDTPLRCSKHSQDMASRKEHFEEKQWRRSNHRKSSNKWGDRSQVWVEPKPQQNGAVTISNATGTKPQWSGVVQKEAPQCDLDSIASGDLSTIVFLGLGVGWISCREPLPPCLSLGKPCNAGLRSSCHLVLVPASTWN